MLSGDFGRMGAGEPTQQALIPLINQARERVLGLSNQEEGIVAKRQAEIKALDINTKANMEQASSTFQADKAVKDLRFQLIYSAEAFRKIRNSGLDIVDAFQKFEQDFEQSEAIFQAMRTSGRLGMGEVQSFKRGFQTEDTRFDALKGAGLLSSEEIAAGELAKKKRGITLGTFGGGDLGGGMLSTFSNDFIFTIKDALSQALDATHDFAQSIKSSFKDAFMAILSGGQSVGEAFRNFGLALANKALEKSIDYGANALFGGLQALGSAAYSRYGPSPATGATGGYVTGGSGIRDDVPAMLNEGDFVLRKSSVAKYGTGFLNALNFANGGGVDTRNNLSNFALSDENNPQNRLRMEMESNDLNAMLQYLQAKKAYNDALKTRRIGALMNVAITGAAAGLKYGASRMNYSNYMRARPGMLDAPSGYGSAFAGYAASGGVMTSMGVRTYASGGSVDNVPALLTGGEYGVNRNEVSRHGVEFFHQLNRGEVPRFNTGGFVGESIEVNGGNGSNLNDSISRLINSNEKLRTSMEKGGGDQEGGGMISQPAVGNLSITVNIDKGGNAKADVQTQSDQSQNTSEDNAAQGKRIGEVIKAAVLDSLIKETRNGGILEQSFVRRR